MILNAERLTADVNMEMVFNTRDFDRVCPTSDLWTCESLGVKGADLKEVMEKVNDLRARRERICPVLIYTSSYLIGRMPIMAIWQGIIWRFKSGYVETRLEDKALEAALTRYVDFKSKKLHEEFTIPEHAYYEDPFKIQEAEQEFFNDNGFYEILFDKGDTIFVNKYQDGKARKTTENVGSIPVAFSAINRDKDETENHFPIIITNSETDETYTKYYINRDKKILEFYKGYYIESMPEYTLDKALNCVLDVFMTKRLK